MVIVRFLIVCSAFILANVSISHSQPAPPENLRVGGPGTNSNFEEDFSGDADSLSPYRNILSEAEARHWLTHAAFGGKQAEVEDLQSTGVQQYINRWVYGTRNPILEQLPNIPIDTADRWVNNTWALMILEGQNPLHERLSVILHDLLATSCSGHGGPQCLEHMDLIRRNALGNWRDMLQELSTDYLMLSWLNGRDNRAGAPDENYSREFWELFSLGETSKYTRSVRLYNDQDIVESSRAFTGWRQRNLYSLNEGFTRPSNGQVYAQGDIVEWNICNDLRIVLADAMGVDRDDIDFPCELDSLETYLVDYRYDDGSKTIWGGTSYEQVGNFGALDLVNMTLDVRPEAAEWIAMRLFTGLVHNSPDRSVTTELASIIREDSYDIRRAVATILASQAMFSPQARLTRFKDGGTFTYGFLRQTGFLPDSNRQHLDYLFRYWHPNGYMISEPPSVNGWPHNKINDGAAGSAFFLGWMPSYSNHIAQVTNWMPRSSEGAQLLENFIGTDIDMRDRGAVVDRIASRFNVSLTPNERDILIDYYRYWRDYSNTQIEVTNSEIDAREDRWQSKIKGIIWLVTNHRDYMMY